jgi:hypothetical protein
MSIWRPTIKKTISGHATSVNVTDVMGQKWLHVAVLCDDDTADLLAGDNESRVTIRVDERIE